MKKKSRPKLPHKIGIKSTLRLQYYKLLLGAGNIVDRIRRPSQTKESSSEDGLYSEESHNSLHKRSSPKDLRDPEKRRRRTTRRNVLEENIPISSRHRNRRRYSDMYLPSIDGNPLPNAEADLVESSHCPAPAINTELPLIRPKPFKQMRGRSPRTKSTRSQSPAALEAPQQVFAEGDLHSSEHKLKLEEETHFERQYEEIDVESCSRPGSRRGSKDQLTKHGDGIKPMEETCVQKQRKRGKSLDAETNTEYAEADTATGTDTLESDTTRDASSDSEEETTEFEQDEENSLDKAALRKASLREAKRQKALKAKLNQETARRFLQDNFAYVRNRFYGITHRKRKPLDPDIQPKEFRFGFKLKNINPKLLNGNSFMDENDEKDKDLSKSRKKMEEEEEVKETWLSKIFDRFSPNPNYPNQPRNHLKSSSTNTEDRDADADYKMVQSSQLPYSTTNGWVVPLQYKGPEPIRSYENPTLNASNHWVDDFLKGISWNRNTTTEDQIATSTTRNSNSPAVELPTYASGSTGIGCSISKSITTILSDSDSEDADVFVYKPQSSHTAKYASYLRKIPVKTESIF